jgi:hypothetical protein
MMSNTRVEKTIALVGQDELLSAEFEDLNDEELETFTGGQFAYGSAGFGFSSGSSVFGSGPSYSYTPPKDPSSGVYIYSGYTTPGFV